jgi:23S rRNA pseudouridine2605 synthase
VFLVLRVYPISYLSYNRVIGKDVKMKKRTTSDDSQLMRLQKYLSQCGVTSRRHAEEMIRDGKVQVNGVTIREMGTKVDPKTVVVKVNGNQVHLPDVLLYLAMYKPRWMVTTLYDPQNRPSVADLIKDLPLRVYPVGRLDFESEGLLLLTNDGELANKIMHPRYHLKKVYRVEWEGKPTQQQIDKFMDETFLDGKKVKPYSVKMVKEFSHSVVFEIVLMEGLYRQIRRMSEKVNLKVIQLKRIAIGEISLGGMAAGQYRHLDDRELAYLRSVAGKKSS